jgi:hypothetical protein
MSRAINREAQDLEIASPVLANGKRAAPIRSNATVPRTAPPRHSPSTPNVSAAFRVSAILVVSCVGPKEGGVRSAVRNPLGTEWREISMTISGEVGKALAN